MSHSSLSVTSIRYIHFALRISQLRSPFSAFSVVSHPVSHQNIKKKEKKKGKKGKAHSVRNAQTFILRRTSLGPNERGNKQRNKKRQKRKWKNKTSNTFALWVQDIRASRPLFRKKGDIEKRTLLHYEKISEIKNENSKGEGNKNRSTHLLNRRDTNSKAS